MYLWSLRYSFVIHLANYIINCYCWNNLWQASHYTQSPSDQWGLQTSAALRATKTTDPLLYGKPQFLCVKGQAAWSPAELYTCSTKGVLSNCLRYSLDMGIFFISWDCKSCNSPFWGFCNSPWQSPYTQLNVARIGEISSAWLHQTSCSERRLPASIGVKTGRWMGKGPAKSQSLSWGLSPKGA